MQNKKTLNKMILSAMFLATGIVLPFFTSQVKEIGDTLLPMHIPVLLCGLICGAKYGFWIGLILPLLRSVLCSMPPIYPNAVWMACELAAYGFAIGFMYAKLKKQNILSIYISLIGAQIAGRVVWGIVKSLLLGVSGKTFALNAFFIGGFIDAAPGIILQLVLIPFIVSLVNRFSKK